MYSFQTPHPNSCIYTFTIERFQGTCWTSARKCLARAQYILLRTVFCALSLVDANRDCVHKETKSTYSQCLYGILQSMSSGEDNDTCSIGYIINTSSAELLLTFRILMSM